MVHCDQNLFFPHGPGRPRRVHLLQSPLPLSFEGRKRSGEFQGYDFVLQDIGLKYMSDMRHMPDTLFIVAEGDFRFYHEDCVGDCDWLSELDKMQAEPVARHRPVKHSAHPGVRPNPDAPPGLAEPDAPPGLVRPPFLQRNDDIPDVGSWQPGARCRMREGHVTFELQDLVRCCTTAHREGLGNVVWLSWVGARGRKRGPSHGSKLLGISRNGATLLQYLMDKTACPMAFDVWLKNMIVSGWGDAAGLGASYVYPSIGGYDYNMSSCLPKNIGPGQRQKEVWDEVFCQPGVRPVGVWDSQRYICKFVKYGPPIYTRVIDFSDNVALCWITEPPPSDVWDQSPAWLRVLQARDWVDPNTGEWLGIPSKLFYTRRRYSPLEESGTSRPRVAREWYEMAKAPNSFAWEKNIQAWSPISRIAEQVVIDYPEYNPLATQSERSKHVRRKMLAMYKRRIFAPTRNMLAVGCCISPLSTTLGPCVLVFCPRPCLCPCLCAYPMSASVSVSI